MKTRIIRPPGHPEGPCKGKCGHPYCQDLKSTAEERCTLCGAPIGYNQSFYTDPDGTLAHTACLNAEVEQRR